jgi:hypothetical protein
MDNRNFHRSAEYCAGELKKAGLTDVELIESPADGKTFNGDLTMPKAWEIDDATLKIVQPAEADMVLASFIEEPLSVSTFSAPTPPEGIEAEILLLDGHVEADVSGTIVIAKDGEGLEKALRAGAIGYITSPISTEPHVRDPNDIPDARGWDHAYVFQPANEVGKFAFVLTPRQMKWLEDLIRRRLREGKGVRVRAVVKSRLFAGTVPMVTATIRGTDEPEKEVLLDSHLYEPGALDNASGCGILLESARVLMKLISEGRLSPPKRTIRFFLGMEFHSISAYAIANIGKMRDIVGSFYVDSLGGSPAATKAPYLLVRNHDAIASYTDVLLEDIVKARFESKDPYLKFIVRPFWGNDPAVTNDPLIGMQMTSLIQHPNKYYHTSQDTPDLLTAEGIKTVGPIPGTFAYFIANASLLDATWLLAEAASDGRCQLEEGAAEACKAILTPLASRQQSEPGTVAHALISADEKLRYIEERTIRVLRTIAPLLNKEGQVQIAGMISLAEISIRRLGEEARTHLHTLITTAVRLAFSEEITVEEAINLTPDEREAIGLVPMKIIPGMLTFRRLSEQEREEANKSYKYPNAMYWVDGNRTVFEIARLHRNMTGEYDPAALVKQFKMLKRHEYVALRES